MSKSILNGTAKLKWLFRQEGGTETAGLLLWIQKPEELEKPGAWTFFGVDTGLACFADAEVSFYRRDAVKIKDTFIWNIEFFIKMQALGDQFYAE